MSAQKIIAVAAAVIGVVILVAVTYIEYKEIKYINAQNQVLTKELEETKTLLTAEIERSSRVEEAMTRLEENDNDRRAQFTRFERRLNELAKQDEEVRDVLSVVIPDKLVYGLHSFPTSESDKNTTSAR